MSSVLEEVVDGYRIRVHTDPREIDQEAWNALLAASSRPTPFMRHEYLAAMHSSGSAVAETGWSPHFVTLWLGESVVAACPVYEKMHSYGEYVFDFAWARAYQERGLPYYPKAVIAPPFTPVPGSRLLARDDAARTALALAVTQTARARGWSSVHLLFADEAAPDTWMPRDTVQFHWENRVSTPRAEASALPPEAAPFASGRPTGESDRHPAPYANFEDFLAALSQPKRKNIRQERRKVAEAGVSWTVKRGSEISTEDWRFFYRCYERTYLEHGNLPYLTPAFFEAMQRTMPEAWVLFIGSMDGEPIATSLIAVNDQIKPTHDHLGSMNTSRVAYGRYWGALKRVDCLHFEACYYQPLQWCIANGYHRFEGGAQGEHKLARGLDPTPASSAHWLAHPGFADAVARFLSREREGVGEYLHELEGHRAFKVGE